MHTAPRPESFVCHVLTLGLLTAIALATQSAAASDVRNALDSGKIGLYSAQSFRLTNGQCKDCATVPQALWYFRDDVIAVPKQAAAEFSASSSAQDDVRAWLKTYSPEVGAKLPPLLWLGSPQIVDGVRLADKGNAIVSANGQSTGFAVVPKIASNLSYYNDSSVQHFADRPLRMRGQTVDDRFVARTIWPEDYAIDFSKLPYQPLKAGETIQSIVRQDGAHATAPLAARILWQRQAGGARDWAKRPALAFMLNGAQGDDDEAHGGHFAVATGNFGERGQWGDWIINNFYNLDSVSEKGIIAAMLPMDAYMADINSGQSWYRPSYMLVAVLKQERAASLYQQAIGRVYNHLYRHDFHYRHTTANCAGISIETLRSLGWNIPQQGPTSRLKATIGLPFKAITDMSIDSGRKAYDYLIAERTDLYPFVAFEAAGQDLLNRVLTSSAGNTGGTGLERMLADDVEAIIYVNIPQFPSSRAVGQAPVASIDEYMKRTPEDKAQWKIVPVGPRPFPAELKDAKAPAEAALPSTIALIGYGIFFGICALFLVRRIARNRAKK